MIRTSFSLSYTESGLLLSAFTIAYGVGHLPSGWLSDRVSPLLMIFIGIAGVAIAGLVFGLAPVFPMLIVANVLIGIAGSGYHPSASYLIGRITKPEQRGSALGLHVIGGSASFFLAPLLAGAIAIAVGWRGTYISLSIFTLLLGIVMVLLLRRATNKRGIARTEPRAAKEAGRGLRFWIWISAFLALSTLSGSLVGSTIGFIPLVMVDVYGFREEAAAGLQAIIFSGGFWAAPLAGYLSDRVGKLPLLFVACTIAIPAVFLLPRIAVGPGLYLLFVLIGVFVFVRMPVSEAFLFANAPARQRATLLGVYFLGSSVGGGVFTPLIGWLSDVRNFQFSFAVIAVILLVLTVVTGIVLTMLRHEGRRSVKPEATPAAAE